jgi:hypothetical protein
VACFGRKWPQIQAVADALWKRRALSGEEATEIIEQVEDRIRCLPPSVEEFMKNNPALGKPEGE